MKTEKTLFNLNLIRYNQNVIFNHGTSEVHIIDDTDLVYNEPSKTDKESYRITLASLRGVLSQSPLGSPNKGEYSLKDGKYDQRLDFSYLRRKDLTVVDIENYINNFKQNLENYDESLKVKIMEDIQEADNILKLKKEKQNVDNIPTSE